MPEINYCCREATPVAYPNESINREFVTFRGERQGIICLTFRAINTVHAMNVALPSVFIISYERNFLTVITVKRMSQKNHRRILILNYSNIFAIEYRVSKISYILFPINIIYREYQKNDNSVH